MQEKDSACSQPARPDCLPQDAMAMHTLGPFDAQSLPAGILRSHRLGAGRWGCLSVTAGNIHFVWEEGSEERVPLGSGSVMIIPPLLAHRLELVGDVSLTIALYTQNPQKIVLA